MSRTAKAKKSAKVLKRNFEAQAAEQAEQLVRDHPDQQWKDLYQFAMKGCPAIREWMDGHMETALRSTFTSLLKYATAKTGDGEKVRLLYCYRKFITTEDGKETQLSLWKHAGDLNRDEATLVAKDLRGNAQRCIRALKAFCDYWHELHPRQKPLQMSFDFSQEP